MRKTVDIFLPAAQKAVAEANVNQFFPSTAVKGIYLLQTDDDDIQLDGCVRLAGSRLASSQMLRQVASIAKTDYALIITKPTPLTLGDGALERMVRVAQDTDAAMVYADHWEKRKAADGTWTTEKHPAIDYQEGAIRDDFDFGSVLLVRSELYEETYYRCLPHGVFTFSKPIDRETLTGAMRSLCTVRERIRAMEKKQATVEERIEELRLINKAKWLLIQHRGCSEEEAHRSILSRAMEQRRSKKEIAQEIIRTFSEAVP
jgi:hypothetical protein